MTPPQDVQPRVAIVGGGLAGLAAAAAICRRGCQVTVYESRRQLGGRAASFRDPQTDELVDHCQHVGMGCCTNLADLTVRTGIAGLLRRHRVLHFFGADGRRSDLTASRLLPPPLHLAPALARLHYLCWRDRLAIARAMWRLMRLKQTGDTQTAGQWLRDQRQSPEAIDRFWSVVLVSALGDSVDRVSLAYARKVFVDGFLAARRACEIDVPTVPLARLYTQGLQAWLAGHGVEIRLGAPVRQVAGDAQRATGLALGDGTQRECDAVIVAVPWQRVAELLPSTMHPALPWLEGLQRIAASPISAVHLWFDQPVTGLEHAVFVGTLVQWVFARPPAWPVGPPAGRAHYYQAVISASREMAGRDRGQVVAQIVAELARAWPAVRQARLLRWRLVTEQAAVFSAAPRVDTLRPPQATAVPRLFLAGDWTATGWPATMEGAVRSGYLAAEAVLRAMDKPAEPIVAPDLPRGWLSRLLIA